MDMASRGIKCGGPMGAGTVSASYLYRTFRAAHELGARKPVLLAEAGLDECDLRNPLARVSGLLLPRLIDITARELRDPAVAFRMAPLFAARSLSDIGYVAQYQPTLGAAFEHNLRSISLSQTIVTPRLERGRQQSRISFDMVSASAAVMRPFLELLLAHWRASAAYAAERTIAMISASMAYDAPAHAGEYARALGCPVRFGAAVTSFEVPTEALDMPLPRCDMGLARRMDMKLAALSAGLGGGASFSQLCTAYLIGEMDKSPLTLARTAAALGTSERSLRRRIKDEGTSFRALLEHVRRELCDVYLLEPARSMEEIALLLGYSETSAFTRAHSRWYGVPPSRVQRSLRAAA